MNDPTSPDLPPWALGVVRTKKAPEGSWLEWTSDADIADLIRQCASEELGGLQWLQIPGLIVVQIESLDMIKYAIELRVQAYDPISQFVLALPEGLTVTPELISMLCAKGISVSHCRGSSAQESAIQELCRLLLAGQEGILNLRLFAESLAKSGPEQASPHIDGSSLEP